MSRVLIGVSLCRQGWLNHQTTWINFSSPPRYLRRLAFEHLNPLITCLVFRVTSSYPETIHEPSISHHVGIRKKLFSLRKFLEFLKFCTKNQGQNPSIFFIILYLPNIHALFPYLTKAKIFALRAYNSVREYRIRSFLTSYKSNLNFLNPVYHQQLH